MLVSNSHKYRRDGANTRACMRAHTQSAGERRSADWQGGKIRGRKTRHRGGRKRERRRTRNKQETTFYSERQRRGREKRREEGREPKQKERSLEKERVRGCTSWSRSEKIQHNAFN